MCYDPPRVRILMDYRAALRQRTGAGEYVHRLAGALQARSRHRRLADPLFQLVEGPAG